MSIMRNFSLQYFRNNKNSYFISKGPDSLFLSFMPLFLRNVYINIFLKFIEFVILIVEEWMHNNTKAVTKPLFSNLFSFSGLLWSQVIVSTLNENVNLFINATNVWLENVINCVFVKYLYLLLFQPFTQTTITEINNIVLN